MRETPTRTISASCRPRRHAVVEADRELDRRDALEVLVVEDGPRAGAHLGGRARDPRDRLHRVAQDVAVVDAGAAADLPHGLAQLGVDERVEQHRRASLGALDCEAQVVGRLGARVPDLLEILVGELRLERLDEPGRRRPGRVRDDVQLNRALARHRPILADRAAHAPHGSVTGVAGG